MAFRESTARAGLRTPWDDLLMAQAGGDFSVYALFKGIISQESAWNPAAENPADPSAGLMQILIGSRGPYPQVTKEQILDPQTNIVLGTNFLKSLLTRYSQSDAVAAYNAGIPRKNAAGQYTNSKGSTQVQDYVDAVLTYQTWFMNNLPAIQGGSGIAATPVWAPPASTVWGGSLVDEFSTQAASEEIPSDDTPQVMIDEEGNIVPTDDFNMTPGLVLGGAGLLIVAALALWAVTR